MLMGHERCRPTLGRGNVSGHGDDRHFRIYRPQLTGCFIQRVFAPCGDYQVHAFGDECLCAGFTQAFAGGADQRPTSCNSKIHA
ncbi:hypothetical protein D3C76_1312840 [compost metagenome]